MYKPIKWIAAPLLLTLTAGLAFAQSPTSDFEVASVKLSLPDARFTSFSEAGAFTYTATNASLSGLIGKAFGVIDSQIVGLPKWQETTHYDIVAKPPGDEPFNEAQLQQALQQLLKDRLHLSTHLETRQVKGYNLTVDRGTHLQPSKGGPIGRIIVDADGFEAPNITLPQLSQRLQSSLFVGEPIVDMTGISGSFHIKLKCAMDADPNSTLPSIFTALQEQLGLKLEPSKIPLDTVIIDHIDPPSAN